MLGYVYNWGSNTYEDVATGQTVNISTVNSELDITLKKIKVHLNNVLDSIVKGNSMEIDFRFFSDDEKK